LRDNNLTNIIRKMEQSITHWVLGHKITTFSPTGDYDFMVGETPAKVQGPPPHLHYSYTESFLVLEGEMEFFLNGETKNVRAGEFVDLPPNALHTFANISDLPCKWVNIHSPKGFARFFENIGIPIEEENAQQKSVDPEVFRQVIETAANYDMLLKLS
jgi:mannose-6-phosphate isomerase-like protein (cupin superfamily)